MFGKTYIFGDTCWARKDDTQGNTHHYDTGHPAFTKNPGPVTVVYIYPIPHIGSCHLADMECF